MMKASAETDRIVFLFPLATQIGAGLPEMENMNSTTDQLRESWQLRILRRALWSERGTYIRKRSVGPSPFGKLRRNRVKTVKSRDFQQKSGCTPKADSSYLSISAGSRNL